jgi:SAM-dependent methyltransferase
MERRGAKQKKRFDPGQAARLDDPARFRYLPPRRLFALLAAPRNATVIDFGAGTGTYAIKLAQARPDITIIAFDEQRRMLALLKKKLSAAPHSNVRPLLADAKGYSTAQGRADRILALNVLHELGNAALNKMKTLLKAKGRILFVDWNGAIDRPVGPPRDQVYSPAEAARKLAKFNMKVNRKRLLRYHFALVCEIRDQVRARIDRSAS